jgi:copper chaperone
MNTLQFKTNINCGGCVKAVTPTLDAAPAIQSWQVDTARPDKLLTVTGELTPAQVVELVAKAGFQAQPA